MAFKEVSGEDHFFDYIFACWCSFLIWGIQEFPSFPSSVALFSSVYLSKFRTLSDNDGWSVLVWRLFIAPVVLVVFIQNCVIQGCYWNFRSKVREAKLCRPIIGARVMYYIHALRLHYLLYVEKFWSLWLREMNIGGKPGRSVLDRLQTLLMNRSMVSRCVRFSCSFCKMLYFIMKGICPYRSLCSFNAFNIVDFMKLVEKPHSFDKNFKNWQIS